MANNDNNYNDDDDNNNNNNETNLLHIYFTQYAKPWT